MEARAWIVCLVIGCVASAVGCNSSVPESANAMDRETRVATPADPHVASARQLAARAAGTDVAELRRASGPLWQRPRMATVGEGTADMAAVEQLRTTSESSEPAAVRAEAVRGLGYVKDVDSLPQLVEMLSDDARVVQEAAFYSVSRITGVLPGHGMNRADFYRGYSARHLYAEGSRFVEYMKNPERAAEDARKAIDAAKSSKP